MTARSSFICSALTQVKTNLFNSIGGTGFVMTVLNPSKGALMKCTFADMKGGTRERRRERRGWVCEGEKGPGDRGRGTLIKSIFPLAVLRGMEKGGKNGLTREDVMEDNQGEWVGGWFVGSPPLSSSQVTVKTLRGIVHTFS